MVYPLSQLLQRDSVQADPDRTCDIDNLVQGFCKIAILAIYAREPLAEGKLGNTWILRLHLFFCCADFLIFFSSNAMYKFDVDKGNRIVIVEVII